MIRSFPKLSLLNPGGLGSFVFVPRSDLVREPAITAGRVAEVISLKNGCYWRKGYSTAETLKFNEKTNITDNGKSYDQSVIGNYPGDNAEVQALFSIMEEFDKTYLIVFTDLLGKQRIAGVDGLLFFTSDFNSDEKRYSFSFEGKTLEKAPIYPYTINI